jgi:cytochrome c6
MLPGCYGAGPQHPSTKRATTCIEKENEMRKHILMTTVVLSVGMMSAAAFAAETKGEAIFKAKCASCHPDGGNVINPKETLKGIKNPKKILTQIRKGGGGMPVFDTKTISDADAKLLADYIMKTFKK